MIEKAIARITDEMMKLGDEIARGIEEHLTEICTTDQIAEKLLDPKKTLKEIHTKVWDKARAQKKGNSAVLTSEEVFAMVDEYYGISDLKNAAAGRDNINVLDLL